MARAAALPRELFKHDYFVSGAPGTIIFTSGRPYAVISFEVVGHQIPAIYA